MNTADILRVLKDRALDAALEGITIADARQPDNPLVYVNHGFEILTGYAAAEVLGTNCRFLQGPDTNPETTAIVRSAVENEQPCVVEILNHHKNGTPFWNRLSITPIHDNEGRTTHFIGVQSDVTARRRAEDELRQANQEMQAALDAAAQVQNSLLPHDLPQSDAVEIAWRLEPCATLAGDILNASWLDDRYLACYVLDVVGHGVAAALLSFTLSHFLTPGGGNEGNEHPSPTDVAQQLNQRFPFHNERQQFFTLLYGVLDTQMHSFEYVSAGHPPLIHQPTQGSPCISGATGFPIGVVEDPDYQSHTLSLAPGDRLLLYSDGVVEAGEQQGRPWGIQGLSDVLHTMHGERLDVLLDHIVETARLRYHNQLLADDLSLLALEVK